jgi:hypothetical protein
MLFKIVSRLDVSLRSHATIFSVAANAHLPRQFEIQFRLHAKVMRVLHAFTPGICVMTRVSKSLLNCPVIP